MVALLDPDAPAFAADRRQVSAESNVGKRLYVNGERDILRGPHMPCGIERALGRGAARGIPPDADAWLGLRQKRSGHHLIRCQRCAAERQCHGFCVEPAPLKGLEATPCLDRRGQAHRADVRVKRLTGRCQIGDEIGPALVLPGDKVQRRGI